MATSTNVAIPNGNRTSLESIVFKSRGRPDVCLTVFTQEFHVHSVILKLYSDYFFRFFDSPDKEHLPSIDSRFKYTWITKCDEDGKDWALICAGPKTGGIDFDLEFKGKQNHEILVFNKFLQALYDLPYQLKHINELEALTKFADFYRALPKISRSLTVALHASPNAESWIALHPVRIIHAAAKLRHEILFKDGFIIYNTRPMYISSRRVDPPKLDQVHFKIVTLCTGKQTTDFVLLIMIFRMTSITMP